MKRSGMRHRSAAAAARQREYSVWRRAFLDAHPWCVTCEQINDSGAAGDGRIVCRRRSSEIHHRRLTGQGGAWMLEENALATCGVGHAWIHNHPTEAVKLELIVAMSNTDYARLAEDVRMRPTCPLCEGEFTKAQWDDRHWADGEDLHAACCEAAGCDGSMP